MSNEPVEKECEMCGSLFEPCADDDPCCDECEPERQRLILARLAMGGLDKIQAMVEEIKNKKN